MNEAQTRRYLGPILRNPSIRRSMNRIMNDPQQQEILNLIRKDPNRQELTKLIRTLRGSKQQELLRLIRMIVAVTVEFEHRSKPVQPIRRAPPVKPPVARTKMTPRRD